MRFITTNPYDSHCLLQTTPTRIAGLAAPPFPGPREQEIFETISQAAWDDWQAHQTMLINEKHLNMMDKAARKYLTEQRDRFFEGDQVDEAEGYLAPEDER